MTAAQIVGWGRDVSGELMLRGGDMVKVRKRNQQ
jgi:hypothetical protein